MKTLTFQVTQYAYDENGQSLHGWRRWRVHTVGLQRLRAEIVYHEIAPGEHSTPPYKPEKDYLRYLIIINEDHFW